MNTTILHPRDFLRVTFPQLYQASVLDFRDGPQRKRFSIKKFAEKYNLEGPIAGNFMRVGYDDNVPQYSKRMGL